MRESLVYVKVPQMVAVGSGCIHWQVNSSIVMGILLKKSGQVIVTRLEGRSPEVLRPSTSETTGFFLSSVNGAHVGPAVIGCLSSSFTAAIFGTSTAAAEIALPVSVAISRALIRTVSP